MSLLQKWYHHLAGYFHIPATMEIPDECILHLADTPSSTYKGIKKLIEQVKPKIIIHTGDLVDEIKLEYQKKRVEDYNKKLKSIMKILGESGAKVYITLGNHDDENLVRAYESEQIHITKDQLILGISCGQIGMGHYPEKVCELEADFWLYGHDISYVDHVDRSLNGIHYLHMIDGVTGQVQKITYPMGTDEHRIGYRKRGL